MILTLIEKHYNLLRVYGYTGIRVHGVRNEFDGLEILI